MTTESTANNITTTKPTRLNNRPTNGVLIATIFLVAMFTLIVFVCCAVYRCYLKRKQRSTRQSRQCRNVPSVNMIFTTDPIARPTIEEAPPSYYSAVQTNEKQIDPPPPPYIQ